LETETPEIDEIETEVVDLWSAPPVDGPPPAPPSPRDHCAGVTIPRGEYTARLSPADHVDVHGKRLTRAYEVLQQDRINHTTAKKDREDVGDAYSTKALRDCMAQRLAPEVPNDSRAGQRI